MILVDTSVWVRFLAGKEPLATELDHLLGLDEVLRHDLVFGELLIGDRGGRPKLLEIYSALTPASVMTHADVVLFVRHRKLHGLGIGWIDAHLLAVAVADRAELWTADRHLAAVAQDIGVSHDAR